MRVTLVSQTEEMLKKAEELIGRNEYQKAENLLQAIVKDIPSDWKHFRQISVNAWEYAFWDNQEREAFLPFFEEHYKDAQLSDVHPSFSKVYYHLAFLAFEQDNAKKALSYIDAGLSLEPDHPSLLCEKALILHHSGSLDKAYELYVKAVYTRPWMPKMIRAKALRGAAIILVEKNRLDAAANMLKKSLELDPGNQLAMNELSNIYLLRMESFNKDKEQTNTPWWKFWQRREESRLYD